MQEYKAICEIVRNVPARDATPDHGVARMLDEMENPVPEAWLDWARKLNANGREDDAAFAVAKAAAAAGNDRRPYILLTQAARLFVELGYNEKSVDGFFDRDERRFGGSSYALAFKATVLLSRKKFENAVELLGDSAENAPILMRVFCEAARCSGFSNWAVKKLEDYRADGKADTQNLVLLGTLLAEDHKFDRAMDVLESCRSGVAGTPAEIDVIHALARTLAMNGRPQEAVHMMRPLYYAWKGGKETVNLLADALIQSGEATEAIAILENEKDNRYGQELLCKAYAFTGDRENFDRLKHMLRQGGQKNYLEAFLLAREGHLAEAARRVLPDVQSDIMHGKISHRNTVVLYAACAPEDYRTLAEIQNLCASRPNLHEYIAGNACKLREGLLRAGAGKGPAAFRPS